MSETKLMDCPFCGSSDIDAAFAKWGDGAVSPGCMSCGATAETQEGWNTRAATPAPAAPIPSVDRCAKCGEPRKEHAYNGACYGMCGEFVVATPVPAPVDEALVQRIQDSIYRANGCTLNCDVSDAIRSALAAFPAPEAAPTIDDVPSCGQENDYRRAKPAAAPSPIMQVAAKAAKTVEGWSDAKREYADRVTGAPAAAPTPDLTDPNVVHVNMLRGTIAKPTWEQIKHLYPEQAAAPTREEIISIVEDECFLNHFSPVEKTKSRKTLWRVGHNIRERILALKSAPAK